MTEQERTMYQELAYEFWEQIEKEAAELEEMVHNARQCRRSFVPL